MKKVLSIAIAILFINITFAQQTGTNVTATTLDSGLASGWVANTATKTLFVKVGNAWDIASIQLVETKVSGTVAGTSVLVGSNDGVNFVDISRPNVAASATTKAYSDTLTSTNVTTNTRIWVIANKTDAQGNTPDVFPYQYIGIKKTGSGTMVSTVKAYATFKHK